MELKKLTKSLEIVEIIGDTDIEIVDIKTESNLVTKGSVFVCLDGENYNGHDYIRQAEIYGAVAIVTQKKMEVNVTQIIVNNTRKALSVLASEFYNNAHKNLKIIGVTGTNGKTTTTHLIASILINNGVKCGIIGTLGVKYMGITEESSLTTPDPLELHRIFSNMHKKGVEVVVMEISAHAVYYDKVFGLSFESLIFTNFTQDHLDFFKEMSKYKQAKLKLFNASNSKYIITNVDDAIGLEISQKFKCITYGLDNPADNFAIDVIKKGFGSQLVMNLFDKVYNVKLNLIGKYNVYNALASATACGLLGIDLDKVVYGIESLKGVDGRLECAYAGDFTVFIDYAHTPDGLEKSLSALKDRCENRLICVFGCGGNRDKTKRSIMGETSAKMADFTIITSDNPRYEEPMEIIWDIEKGVLRHSKNYVIIEDRTEAIKYALAYAKNGDVVLIAGKGSEKYQEVFGIKRFYNDKDTIEDVLRG